MVRKNVVKETRPCFFKVILPGYSTEHLMIPPQFLEHIRKDLSSKATLILEKSSQRSWNVKVTKTKKYVSFTDGWKEFLDSNSVDEGYFLVFTYEGKMHFSIACYDRSCCEIEDFPNGICQKATVDKSTIRPRCRARKDNSAFYGEHLSAGNYEFANLKVSGGNQWYKVKLVPSVRSAFMSKGWSIFTCDNQIQVGLVCVFELVKGTKWWFMFAKTDEVQADYHM